MADIRIRTKTAVMTRLKVLYSYVYEMAAAFGVDESALITIKKGILDKQILESIHINFMNESNTVIGRVVIDIDWEEHRLRASSDYGSTIELDPTQPISHQLTDLADIIINHVEKMKEKYEVKQIDTTYTYVPEIRNDANKLKETRKYFGHVAARERRKRIEPVFNETLSCVIDKLSEVIITVEEKENNS